MLFKSIKSLFQKSRKNQSTFKRKKKNKKLIMAARLFNSRNEEKMMTKMISNRRMIFRRLLVDLERMFQYPLRLKNHLRNLQI